ncbi:MAG: sigma-70 family RNA polymerase sigma factor [Planctomycetaceae bacterium]
MSEVTQILEAIRSGDRHATNELLPLIYDHLRQLAAQKLSHEPAGITIQATALVHEAYVRLVDADPEPQWENRGHFFAAAAEAMRRILIENARKKLRGIKHGGEFDRIELTDAIAESNGLPERLLELDAALTKLNAEDATAAEVVKLHFFAGQSLDDVAEYLGMSRATVYRHWAYARSWLKCEMEGG